MPDPQSRPETQAHSRTMVRLALGLIVTGVVGAGSWFAWRGYRVGVLREEATKAARFGDWGKAEAAVDLLDSYEALDPEATRIRTKAALARRDPLSAARFLGMMPESSPEAPASYEQQGFLLRDTFRLDEAERAFRRAIRLEPGRLASRRALIAILGVERRATDQERELWAFLGQTPTPVEALRVLAQAGPAIPPDGLPPGMDEGKALEQVLKVEPTNDHARAALASFYRGRGEAARARELMSAGHSSHSQILRLEEIASLIDEGELDSLDAELSKPTIPAEWAGNARYARLKADYLMAKGKIEEAVPAYEAALKLDHRSVETRYRMAQALLAAKQPKEAEPYLAYARDTLALKNLVSRLPDQAPDPTLCAEAEKLCRGMERTKEADAWKTLAESKDGLR